MRRAACKAANPLKIRASLGHDAPLFARVFAESQSLKDQGKSRTGWSFDVFADDRSQSLKDQGKSRTPSAPSQRTRRTVAIP